MVKASARQKHSKSFWTINSETLPYKFHFFLYFGAVGGLTPFLTVFTKSKLSLTDGQIASLFATYQLITLLTKPTIGLIVDYFNKLKLVIIILSLLLGTIPSILLALPGIGKNRHDEGASNKTFQSSFALQCDFDSIPVACHLTQKFCYKTKHIERLKNSVQLKLATDAVDVGPFIRSDEFKFCNFNEGFVPHSIASNSIECTKVLGKPELKPLTCVNFTRNVDGKNETSGTFVFSKTTKSEDGFSEGTTLCSSINSSVFTNDEPGLIMYSSKHSDNMHFICRVNYLGYSDCNVFAGLVESLDELPEDSRDDSSSAGKTSPYAMYEFWIFAFFLLCSGTCSNALFTLSDTACYEVLQKTGADYGRQRVWGAVGWGLMSAIAGYLNDLASEHSSLPDYSPGFFICSGFCVLIIINISRVDLVKPDLTKSAWKDMKALLKNTEFIIFETGVFLTGFFVSSIWFYLVMFVDSIGGDKLLMGLVQTSQSLLGAIPFMFFSGWILNKIGYANAMILTFVSYAVRFGYYHVLPDPWWILPIEATHGICYGLFYTTLTSFAKISAPTGAEATTQSLLCCLYEGLGAGLGSIAVGVSFDIFGSRDTYLGLAICACAAAVLQCLATLYLKSRRKTVKISPKGSSINTIT